MVDQELLMDTLAEFARSLARGFAVSDVLDDLTRRVITVLEVDGAGVSLRAEDAGEGAQRLRYVTSLDQRTDTLERVQEREQVGPCIDAWRSGQTVTVPDLRAVHDRWDAYVATAGEVGICSVASIPMNAARDCIGVLDLYDATPREWTDDALRAAAALADMATSYAVHASELDRQRRINEQLEEALDSRVIVEQAKGILAADLGTSIDEAFEALRNHARNHNANLRSVAEAVVRLGLRPD